MVSTMDIVMLSVIALMAAVAIFFILRKKRSPQIPVTTDATNTQKGSQRGSSMTSFSSTPLSQSIQGDIGKTGIIDKLTLNINTATIGLVLSLFGVVLLTFAIKEMAIATMLLGSMLFLPIGMFIGALFSGTMRVWLLRRITKRNYGIIKFIHSNRLIKPVVANLDKDIIRFAGGIYILDKQSIKREGKDAVSDGIIEESAIKFEEGIPTVYFDITDIVPVDFDSSIPKDKESEDDKFRLPSQVSATLNKEIAVEKAKIMKSFRQRQSVLLLVIVILCVLIAGMTYQMWSNWQPLVDSVNALNTKLSLIG